MVDRATNSGDLDPGEAPSSLPSFLPSSSFPLFRGKMRHIRPLIAAEGVWRVVGGMFQRFIVELNVANCFMFQLSRSQLVRDYFRREGLSSGGGES